MNKEKIKQRIVELKEEKYLLENNKSSIWLVLFLLWIPIFGWIVLIAMHEIKKQKINIIEKEIKNLDLYI